jgi:6-phosphogluconate dehydrogenase
LFVTTAEVKAMWRFADPIVEAWEKNAVPLHSYQPNTDTILKDSVRIGEPSSPRKSLKREIGIVGLGKMGGNLARRLVEKGWNVVGWNRTATVTQSLEKEGLQGAYSLKELVEKLTPPRIIWIELPAFVTTSAGKPAGSPVDEALKALFPLLSAGDTVIDGGNSYFKDAIRRQKLLAKRKIEFVDVGVSGGPGGARHGASLMIGGKRESFAKLEPLFYDLARENGYQFFAGHGAGHFVKMVHNGIEYGMMQALAEGFAILKKSKYKLDLTRVADIYNHGSVIESRLVGWLEKAFELHGEDLGGVSGSVKHTGEGAWTVKTAKEMKLKAKIIEGALQFRIQSEKNPSYTGKILSALRGQFGGHPVRSLLPESGRRKKRLTSNGVKRKK